MHQQLIDQPGLRKALLALQQFRTAPAAVSNQGVIYRIELDGRALAVKTVPAQSRLRMLHLRTLQREYHAYQQLKGLSGFPACHGLFDRIWLVLDWVEGQSFRQAALSSDAVFFDQLLANIEAMHERGVAHGDLKRKANLIVTTDQSPMLVDFGAAVIQKSGFHPVNQRLFDFMRQTDLNAWIKLKYGSYSNLSAEDETKLKRSWLERQLSRFRGR